MQMGPVYLSGTSQSFFHNNKYNFKNNVQQNSSIYNLCPFAFPIVHVDPLNLLISETELDKAKAIVTKYRQSVTSLIRIIIIIFWCIHTIICEYYNRNDGNLNGLTTEELWRAKHVFPFLFYFQLYLYIIMMLSLKCNLLFI